MSSSNPRVMMNSRPAPPCAFGVCEASAPTLGTEVSAIGGGWHGQETLILAEKILYLGSNVLVFTLASFLPIEISPNTYFSLRTGLAFRARGQSPFCVIAAQPGTRLPCPPGRALERGAIRPSPLLRWSPALAVDLWCSSPWPHPLLPPSFVCVLQIPIIIPCHRVIRSSGQSGSYGGGSLMKEWLLSHEKLQKEKLVY